MEVGPEQQRAVGERQLAVADQGRRIRARLGAQALAHVAPAELAIERETVRRERLEAAPARLTNAMLAVRFHAPIRFAHLVLRIGDMHHALSHRERGLDTFRDPSPRLGPHRDPVNHDFHPVLAATIDRGRIVQHQRLAVQSHAVKASVLQFVPQRLVALSHLDANRGHQVKPRALALGHHLVHDFVGRLRADGKLAVGAVRDSQASHQDAEVVVDLGRRADGRAWRVAEVLLFDGDGRRESFDVFQLGLLHLADELPGIGAEAFDVPTLALGVDRVHGQRALAAAAGAAEHASFGPAAISGRLASDCAAAHPAIR